MVKDKIYIILVDDSKVFIEGLKILLSECPDYHILDTCRNGKRLIENTNLQKADIVLMDIQMPLMNGIEAAKRINSEYPDLKMLALTMHIDRVLLEDIIGAGFKGFIYKPEVSKKLNEVIHLVMHNEFVFPENIILKKNDRNGGML